MQAPLKYLYPQASQAPVLLTKFTLLLSNQSKASVTAGGESLTDSLSSCARLCARLFSLNRQCTLQLKSIITTAPVLKKCQHQLKRPSVCLSVLLSACFVCLFFREQGEKEENGWLSAVNHKWFAEFISARESLTERHQLPVTFLFFLLVFFKCRKGSVLSLSLLHNLYKVLIYEKEPFYGANCTKQAAGAPDNK